MRRIEGKQRAWFVPLDGRRWILAPFQHTDLGGMEGQWLLKPDQSDLLQISGPEGAELRLGYAYVPVGGAEDDPNFDLDDFALLFA